MRFILSLMLLLSCLGCEERQASNIPAHEGEVHQGEFGSCCKDLKDAMTIPSKSYFYTDESGVFYMTIGHVQADEGTGYFDHAVIHCPFCGKRLQTREEIARLSGSANP